MTDDISGQNASAIILKMVMSKSDQSRPLSYSIRNTDSHWLLHYTTISVIFTKGVLKAVLAMAGHFR